MQTRTLAKIEGGRFRLGKCCETRNVAVNLPPELMWLSLSRHVNCDWSELSEHDRKANERAVTSGDERVFSAYTYGSVKVWVITEADRSVTTVLFPEDY